MKKKKQVIITVILITVLGGVIGTVFLTRHSSHVKTAGESKTVMYHCPMHPAYISNKPGDCPICNMKLVSMKQDHSDHDEQTTPSAEDESGNDVSKIRIDPTTVQNMGVTMTTVQKKNLKKEIRLSATLESNEKELYIVTTKIMGYVEKLHIDFTGQAIRKGQPLLSVYSPELVSTQEEYLQALRYTHSLTGGTQFARNDALELVESAKRRLQNWDITEQQIEELANRGTPQKLITIFAPSNGVVLEKMVLTGQKIEPGMPLYKIANLAAIWAMADVYQDDLPYVKTGMSAEVELSTIPGKSFTGKVTFISPVLNDVSKSAQVRIEISNTPDYMLKPQMFASVKILSPVIFDEIVVPQQSVIYSGTRKVVIISLGNGYFKPQEIKTGAYAEGYVAVLDGLSEGQTIVTSAQFLIDSESNLRTAVSKMTAPQKTDTMENPDSQNPDPDPEHKHTMQSIPEQQNSTGNLTFDNNDHREIYVCPMVEDSIESDKPGRCPKCGMKLVKKDSDK